MSEIVTKNDFNKVIFEFSQEYIEFLEKLNKKIKKNNLQNEKYLKSFESNLLVFKKKDKNYIFKFIITNFLHILPEVVEQNLDFFLTQKRYILKKSSSKKKKVINKKSTFLCKDNMLRYFIEGLKKNPEKGELVESKDVNFLFESITNLFRKLKNDNNDYLIELKEYVTKNYSNQNTLNQHELVINNMEKILSEEVIEEEVSSEEEEENKEKDKKENKKSKNSKSEDTKLPFDDNFIENSSIGKLAKEISEELNPDDLKDLENPSDLIGTLFGNGGSGNSKISNIIGKVVSKVGDKIKNGSLNHDLLGSEAKNIMNSFGGLPNMSNSNMGNLFNNLFKNMSK